MTDTERQVAILRYDCHACKHSHFVPDVAQDSILALIKEAETRARLDELEKMRDEWGHDDQNPEYQSMAWDDYIEYRIAQLNKEEAANQKTPRSGA